MLGQFWQKDSAPLSSRRAALQLEELDSRDVPAVVAVNDTYSVVAGRVLTTLPNNGVLINDFDDRNFGDVLTAVQVGPPRYVGSNRPLPANALTVFPNGAFQFIAPSNVPAGVTQVQFTYQANNLTTPTEPPAQAIVTITLQEAQQKFLAVGSGAGIASQVQVYQVGTGRLVYTLSPYEPTFTGGVRTAVGDLNNDGFDDIAVAPGVGGGGRIIVFDGRSGAPIFDNGDVFNDPNFRGGAYVAIGDFNGDGLNDLIVGAGETGGPRVTVINGTTFTAGGGAIFTLANFFAYESSFRNGVRVAAGDVAGLGRDFIITAPAEGGGPVIKTFDGNQVLSDGFAIPVLSFFAGDPNSRNGAFVAAGDLSGIGRASIIVGSGTGNAVVSVFDGVTGGVLRQYSVPVDEVPSGGGLPTGPNSFVTQSPLPGSLLAPAQAPNALIQDGAFAGVIFPRVARGGVTVTAVDWDGDGLDDVITGAGPGNAPRIRVFQTTDNRQFTNFLAFPNTFLGGVFVGA
jgi:hypothetical protein